MAMIEDRFAEGYEPRFDLDSAIGKQGELFAGDVAKGLQEGTVEVKTDEGAEKYGNVYIEYKCKRRDGWQYSGIKTTQATWWAFALGRRSVLVVLPTEFLLALAAEQWHAGWHTECTRGSHPTKGVLIPISELLPRAITLAAKRAA